MRVCSGRTFSFIGPLPRQYAVQVVLRCPQLVIPATYRQRGVNWGLLVPLAYAPLLPLSTGLFAASPLPNKSFMGSVKLFVWRLSSHIFLF